MSLSFQPTPTQRDLYLDIERQGASPVHSPAVSVRLDADLAPELWNTAVHQVMDEEPLARLRFELTPESGGLRLVQRDLPDSALVDELQPAAPETLIAQIMAPYDLEKGPLIRHALQRQADGGFRSVLGMPHLLTDGHTFRVLFERIGRRYAALREHQPPTRESAASFLDYLAGAVPPIPPDNIAFWKSRFESVAPLIWATPRSADPGFDQVTERLPGPLAADLRRYCAANGISVSIFFLTLGALVFQAFRERNGDWIFHAIKGSRPPAFRDTPGCFYLVIPYRFCDRQFAPEVELADLFQYVAGYRRALGPHQNCPMLDQQNLLPAGGGRLVYNYYDFDQARMLGAGRPLTIHMAHDPAETHVILSDRPDGIDIRLRFHTATFNDRTLPRRLAQVARQVINGARTLRELDWILPEERSAWLEAPAAAAAHATPVQTLFEQQALRAPERIALTDETRAYPYAELNGWAQILADRLSAERGDSEKRIGLFLDRSALQVAALLGVLKAGCAYVPIDPSYPDERLRFILEDSGVPVVLTTPALAGRLAAVPVRTLLLDDTPPADAAQANRASPPVDPDATAYVIYTSGSTGKPKGVDVTHRNVARLFAETEAIFQFGPGDVWPLLHSYAFDFSVWEIWGALGYGGRLVVLPTEIIRAPDALRERFARERVTVLNQTPSAFYRFLPADAEAPPLTDLRYIIFGGEALDPARLQPWLRRYGVDRPALFNLYGITETTVHVTWKRLSAEDIEKPRGSLIGRPIADLQVYLVDPEGRPVPNGVPGEIRVGGPGVARGYLNRPELTRVRFIPDPFDPRPGRRLYCSGDLARRLPDGELEYLGRIDQQIKIRGYRVELGEIEATLRQHPAVGDAAVIAEHRGDEDPQLIGYVVPAPGASLAETQLLQYLRGQLPPYMVCARLVILPALPLTAHGKLDRRALPQPDLDPAQPPSTYAAPRTALEEILVNIFAEVTGAGRVGIQDDFFLLGGHSLSAIRVAARIRELLERRIRIGLIFEHTTPAALARAIEQQTLADEESPGPVFLRHPAMTEFPLTYPQERVWLIQQLNPDSTAYHFEAAIRFHGEFNPEYLEDSLSDLIQRHAILRTTFHAHAGRLFQRIHPRGILRLNRNEIGGVPDSAGHIETWRRGRVHEPIALDQLPLIEWTLFTISPTEHVLLHREHHLLHDGWSFIVLLGDLLELYAARVRRTPPNLPPLPLELGEYADAQRRWIESGALKNQETYWRDQLRDCPESLDLPLDHPRAPRITYAGEALRFDLPAEVVDALKTFSRRTGTTVFMSALSVFAVLLARYAGQADLCIGSGIANRRWKETENLVGMLLNNVIFRLRLQDSPTLRDWVKTVRSVVLQALANQDLPFDRMVQLAGRPRNPAIPPLCQVFFSSYDGAFPHLHQPGLDIDFDAGLPNGGAKFDLNVILIVEPRPVDAANPRGLERVTLIWEYNRDLFEADHMARMTRHFTNLLSQALAHPDEPLDRLPLCDADENAWLERQSAGPVTPYPQNAAVPEIFAAQADRTPEKIAIRAPGQTWSYADLNRQADRLARHLRSHREPGEHVVGLLLERGAPAIAALLGILKAGAAYLPLNPADPPARLNQLIAEAGAARVITRAELADRLSGSGAHPLCIEDLLSREPQLIPDPPDAIPGGDRLACVLFTSGSTGRPKGVEVTHRGILRLVFGQSYAQFGPDETLLQLAPLTFDASTFEIWGALLQGSTLALYPEEVPDLDQLGRTIRENGVTTLWLNAALFNTVIDTQPALLTPLRQLLIGGEALSVKHVRRALTLLPGTRIINGYGPTENTTFSCCYPIPADLPPDLPSIPIGVPLAHSTAHILDAQRQRVPIGVTGEIYLGGDGLARGYRGRPDLTAEKFVPDPFSPRADARLYRSGDLGAVLPDGTIQFRGRRDAQVKIRGFRIEPGEVEAALAQIPGVSASAVVPRENEVAGRSLVAFIIPADAALELDAVRARLRERLPAYLVPDQIRRLDQFPLTAHGKLDRAALKRMAESAESPQAPAPGRAARTPREIQILEVFRVVLGRADIGIDDDFFQVGGHSLMAIRLVAGISERLGTPVNLRLLFQAPSVAALCAALESTPAPAATWRHLLPVRTTGSRRPVFFVPGGGGGTFDLAFYAKLADYLPDHPFYGLLGTSGEENPNPTPVPVEQLAAACIAEMKQIQPHGPYLIAGICVGGIIAFELARQLAATGAELDRVVLIDTFFPTPYRYGRQLVRRFCSRFRYHLKRRLAPPHGELGRRGQWIYSILSAALPYSEREAHPDHRPATLNFAAAVLRYRPQSFPGQLHLVMSQELAARHPETAWNRYARQGTVLSVVPGNHWTYIRDFVDKTGEAVRKALED